VDLAASNAGLCRGFFRLQLDNVLLNGSPSQINAYPESKVVVATYPNYGVGFSEEAITLCYTAHPPVFPYYMFWVPMQQARETRRALSRFVRTCLEQAGAPHA